MNADQLQQLLFAEIPLTAAMQLQVQQAGGDEVRLRAPLAPNRNLHGSAFAGSLYSVATLAGWSLLTVYAEQQGWLGSVVLRHGDIRYLRPVVGDLEASANWDDPAQLTTLHDDVQKRGRGRAIIAVKLHQDGKVAVSFNGEFVFSQH